MFHVLSVLNMLANFGKFVNYKSKKFCKMNRRFLAKAELPRRAGCQRLLQMQLYAIFVQFFAIFLQFFANSKN
jgi:hypothetical protein